MTYEIQTPYGTEVKETLAEAKEFARYAARVTGRAATVRKMSVEEVLIETGKRIEAALPQTFVAELGPGGPPDMTDHDTPCVCGTYDRCKAQRRLDAWRENNWRAEFRAYND